MAVHTTDRSLNMMEVICPEKGLTLFTGETVNDPTPPVGSCQLLNTDSTHSDHGSLLEYLPPDLPAAMGVLKLPNECNESELHLQKTEDDLFERVEKLAMIVRREVDNIRQSPNHDHHDDEREPLHNEEDRGSEGKRQGTPANNDHQQQEEEEEEKKKKVRRALAKMKRLDNRLAEVVKKERQVKQQRIQTESDNDTPPSLSDVSLYSGSHVFQTQPIEKTDKCSTDDDGLRVECMEETDSYSTETGNETSTAEKAQSFIERNKELAGVKGEGVLMTEKEKKRLEELLEEMDDDKEEETREQVCTSVNGYSFTDQDLNRLNQIDSALECVVPTSASISVTTLSVDSKRIEQLGEDVLVKIQSDRSEQQRLKEIDDKLAELQETEDLKSKVGITEDELYLLLLQCQDELDSS